ncbi:unnamed protein product [Pleuronectes platessa]|uniref:Uncharacterized protein n=1 Tax=Pleuronectes platessa TaxID=8262 RepID=A0A9N7YLB6_PLEPL|nr:unnamed protein product [Pleuronectes platessa]
MFLYDYTNERRKCDKNEDHRPPLESFGSVTTYVIIHKPLDTRFYKYFVPGSRRHTGAELDAKDHITTTHCPLGALRGKRHRSRKRRERAGGTEWSSSTDPRENNRLSPVMTANPRPLRAQRLEAGPRRP